MKTKTTPQMAGNDLDDAVMVLTTLAESGANGILRCGGCGICLGEGRVVSMWYPEGVRGSMDSTSVALFIADLMFHLDRSNEWSWRRTLGVAEGDLNVNVMAAMLTAAEKMDRS